MNLICILLIGAGATAIVDLWSAVRTRAFGVAPPNYGFLGRWLAHMPSGRFRHDSIARAAPARGELLLGWLTHYVIGIAFAALVPAIWGVAWLRAPTLAPALLVGVATVAAPLFVMQPAFGFGVAASRTPRPAAARFHSFVTHAVFGVGLYAAGWGVSRLVQL